MTRAARFPCMTEPPADWYPDPVDPSRRRYWDESEWTDHFASSGLDSSNPPKGMTWFVNFRSGWLLVAAGIACGGLAAFLLVNAVGSAIGDSFLREPCTTPCSSVLELDQGDYLVFELVGRSKRIGSVTSFSRGPETLGPADVTVQSVSGQELDIRRPSSGQTIERNGAIYGGAVRFEVPEAGRYTVSIKGRGDTNVLVAPALDQTFVRAVPGVLVVLLGGIAISTGLVVLLMARGRRG